LTTINDPTTTLDSFYAPKQERSRKAIERAFGVLKKFFSLQWYKSFDTQA
jgi:hypothetical protein